MKSSDTPFNLGNPLVRFVIAFVVVGFILAVMQVLFRSRKIQPNGFKWRQVRNEIFFITIGALLGGFFLGAFTKYMNQFVTFNSAPASWWVIFLEYSLYFVLFDTWFYWGHRLMHIEPVYTGVHKIHHFSTSPSILTTFSVNPLESLINGGFVPLFTALVTVHSTTMRFIVPTSIIMGLYVHSGYEFLPRWWNRTWWTKWFITATFHDLHHKHFTGNFGGFTTVWDRICGTMQPRYEAQFGRLKTRDEAPRTTSTGRCQPRAADRRA
jgi:Delta7-sterol 5-desaturase